MKSNRMGSQTRTRKLGTAGGWMIGVAVTAAAVGCAVPAENEETAAAGAESPILGSFAVDGTCSARERNFFGDAAFLARTVVGSSAFEACVRDRVATQYRRCTFTGSDGDPSLTTAQHTANALAATRSVNDLSTNCDRASGAWGHAGVGDDPGYYGTEAFEFGRASMNSANMIGRRMCGAGESFERDGCRSQPFPNGLREVAATVIHENMHQHGYTHGGSSCLASDYDDVRESMPWIVDQCLVAIVDQSMATCGDICSTRAADNISSCRQRGRLKLVSRLGSASCEDAYDPGLGHLGALQLVNGELRALDMLPSGQRYGGSGTSHSSDTLVVKGDFDPGTPGEELIFRWNDGTNRGWQAVGWDVHDTDSAERTVGRGTRRFGDFIDHLGDGGTARWQLWTDNVVLGKGRYSSVASWGAWAPREEILVKDPNGFGVLAVASNFVTRNVLPWGTSFPGAGGGWTLRSGDQVLGQGDLNGDGQTDIILRSASRIGIISRTGAGGTFRTLDARSPDGADGDWGTWNLAGTDQVLAVANFVGDSREEILMKSAWGIGLLGIPAGASTPTSLWGAPWGTVVSTRWTLRNTDQFLQAGNFYVGGTKQMLLKGSDGLATLRWAGSPITASIPGAQHIAASGGSWPEPDTGGHWSYSNTGNQILGYGDFDGDGYDQFVIRSGWGIGIIGRTVGSAPLIVHDANQRDCGPAAEVACHSGLFGSWLARDTDAVVTVLKATDSGADTLVLRGWP